MPTGQLLPAILLVGVSYAGREHSTLAMSLLTVGIALTGFQYGGGLFLSPGDIAPRYTGVVYGISNTMATLPGFLSPMAIGYLTEDQSQEQWRVVFFISAAIYVFGSLFFNLFASASLQPWAQPSSDDYEVTVQTPQEEFLEERL
ncbi:vesicular glutamate transporter 2 [Elysia marginata]|uniref:Vesicular glutamate transporter 2 n=1 Tax=Elysia marginata TaxID=1093978 RepID=A0AAV4IAZ0_9GAST|nr:vesicular glutamate transporter 2 [Elysia marginata]